MAGVTLFALSLVALVAVVFVLRGEDGEGGEDTGVETTADDERVLQIPFPREAETSVREGGVV